MPDDDARKRELLPLVEGLRAALGDARVTSCLDEGDPDPRTARHVSGRSIGRPSCWVRPTTTSHCAEVVRIARAHGATVCPVGEATTFWDGLRVDDAVALDVTALADPLEVDPLRRLVRAGAGCSVGAVDRAARAHRLCLAAYPDTAGDTPVGSLVAVGSTAGRGMGLSLPIDQVSGATVVLGTGEIVRLGASHALGGAPFLRHGLPDVLGLLTAAEGRGAVVTEVALLLRPAPFVVRGRGRVKVARPPEATQLVDALAAARGAIDRGTLATLRVEIAAAAGEPGLSLDLLFECASARDPAEAHAEAVLVQDALEPLLGMTVTLEAESERARAGLLPEYDARFDVPPGQHRRRIEGGAFWGAEVTTSWGDDLRQCLALLLGVHGELAAAAPHHRRLGIYPASHGVSVGVQVLGTSEPERVTQVTAVLERAVHGLLAAGGVPYRTGNLWREALSERVRAVSGGAADPTGVAARCLRVLDPDGVLPGPDGKAGGPAVSPRAPADDEATELAERQTRVRRALLEEHPDLAPIDGIPDLSLPLPGGRVVLKVEPSSAPRAQVKGRYLSLVYRVEGSLSPRDGEDARRRLRAVALTLLRVETAAMPKSPIEELERRVEAARRSRVAPVVPVPAQLLVDPSLLTEAVDRIRRADLDGQDPVTLAGLPPCMDTGVRPETPAWPVARLYTPLVAPCDACGAAVVCPANAAPRPEPARPLRILRHQDATAAALAAIQAVAGAWQRPVPAAALDTLLALLAGRAGVLGVPQVPFELSLKRSATALLPRLRVVEYSPRSRPGLPSREERASLRRDRLIGLAGALGSPEAHGWVESLASHQPPGMELSFGMDVDLHDGRALPQLYAHVEPRDRTGMLATLRGVLAWSGAEGPMVAEAVALASGAAGTPASDVVLVSLSPGPGAPRRIKVYFARRLADGHASGLAPADPGPLRPFAADRGLAVLACDAGALGWDKWDFPCAAHYQRAGGLASAFAEGLDAADRSRIEGLLDGRRFAPWPTWLSVGAAQSTLYFVPR